MTTVTRLTAWAKFEITMNTPFNDILVRLNNISSNKSILAWIIAPPLNLFGNLEEAYNRQVIGAFPPTTCTGHVVLLVYWRRRLPNQRAAVGARTAQCYPPERPHIHLVPS